MNIQYLEKYTQDTVRLHMDVYVFYSVFMFLLETTVSSDQLRLSGTSWGSVGPAETQWDQLRLSGTSWDSVGPAEAQWDQLTGCFLSKSVIRTKH